MAFRLVIGPKAEFDLERAFNWYEHRQDRLGHQFLNAVNATFERIQKAPKLHAIVHRNARLTLVKQFPYVVCYLVQDDVVFVAAVFHGHCDPESWQDRLS